MSTTIHWLFDFLINAAWQITLIFAAAWLLARLVRPLGAGSEHAVWVTALFAELIVPACKLHPEELLAQLIALLQPAPQGSGEVRVIFGSATGASELLHLPSLLTRLAVLLYLGATLFFAARLIWGLRKTRNLLQSSATLTLPEDRAALWTKTCASMHLSQTQISVALSRSLRAPLTIGFLRKWLLLPAALLNEVSPAEFEAACMHECAHMRRNDFAKNLLYSVAALPIAFHPLAWRTLAGIRESRELICDDMAAAALSSHNRYARSLLRLAERLITTPATHAPATQGIGIFDANNFERRIMRLTHPTTHVRGLRRFATIALCALAATAVCASATAWRVETNSSTNPEPGMAQGERPKKVMVSSGVLAKNILSKVEPVYPQEAKEKHIQGTIVLHAVIGADGTVENLQVVSGPKELQQSSLDSVRQWKYKPYLLNGEPIEVESTINVIYNLGK